MSRDRSRGPCRVRTAPRGQAHASFLESTLPWPPDAVPAQQQAMTTHTPNRFVTFIIGLAVHRMKPVERGGWADAHGVEPRDVPGTEVARGTALPTGRRTCSWCGDCRNRDSDYESNRADSSSRPIGSRCCGSPCGVVAGLWRMPRSARLIGRGVPRTTDDGLRPSPATIYGYTVRPGVAATPGVRGMPGRGS